MSRPHCREPRNKYYSKRLPKAARKLDLDLDKGRYLYDVRIEGGRGAIRVTNQDVKPLVPPVGRRV